MLLFFLIQSSITFSPPSEQPFSLTTISPYRRQARPASAVNCLNGFQRQPVFGPLDCSEVTMPQEVFKSATPLAPKAHLFNINVNERKQAIRERMFRTPFPRSFDSKQRAGNVGAFCFCHNQFFHEKPLDTRKRPHTICGTLSASRLTKMLRGGFCP